ncbi:exodeoxyribonuclease VII small subunit [Candidatus Saccharibacteria bacterium]|nr:exodeoxyribonuclease VII small subunit [Candidatus Saccharibacteria bacterium]
MTINEKIAELDKKVEWFYSDEFDLGAAVENYKEAVKLAQEIEKDLTELKNEIEVIDQDFSK